MSTAVAGPASASPSAADAALVASLVRWLNTLGVGNVTGIDQLSDGVFMAAVLHRIEPAFFSAVWKDKIKFVGVDQTRLKVNNLKKVMRGVTEFYTDTLGLDFLADFPVPDVEKVAECDPAAAGRMLQLLLGCAVSCHRKQEHIQVIMGMEESVQQVIMQAIQELLHLQSIGGGGDAGGKTKEAKEEKEQLLQKCHELELQINMLKDEKSNISAEFEHLQSQLGGPGGGGGKSMSRLTSADESSGLQFKELRRQIETLQQEASQLEAQRDEAQVKHEVAEKRLEEAATKEAELQKLADQSRALKDEVDVLRETSDKVSKYEATVESYKKKLVEIGDLKRQNKILEEKNTLYMQQNMDLEEDVKKTGSWKPQVDAYKKQIGELHVKLDAETKKSDKLEFETKKLVERLEAVSVERDRVQNERDELKELNAEFCDKIALLKDGVGEAAAFDAQLEPDSGLLEMIPPTVKEKLFRLERENRKLKAAYGGGGGAGGAPTADDAQILQTLVDDLKAREVALEASNRKANQRIMELESRLEENKNISAVPRVPGSREEIELKLSEATKKVVLLQETIQKKETEMAGMEERYKKYIEKAKSVIKTLDPKQNPNAGGPEVSALRSQLNEKDRLIETLETETEKARAVREMEERLISSAFYNLSMQINRNAVENRLANVNPHNSAAAAQSAGGVGQSFLARQRQVNAGAAAAGRKSGGGGASGGGGGGGGGAAAGFASSDFLEY